VLAAEAGELIAVPRRVDRVDRRPKEPADLREILRLKRGQRLRHISERHAQPVGDCAGKDSLVAIAAIAGAVEPARHLRTCTHGEQTGRDDRGVQPAG